MKNGAMRVVIAVLCFGFVHQASAMSLDYITNGDWIEVGAPSAREIPEFLGRDPKKTRVISDSRTNPASIRSALQAGYSGCVQELQRQGLYSRTLRIQPIVQAIPFTNILVGNCNVMISQ